MTDYSDVAVIALGRPELDAKIQNWFEWDKNENTKNEIFHLLKNNDVNELELRMLHRQAFGTAGIRAPMGAGFNRLNDLVVIQIAQGMVKYMEKHSTEADRMGKGIVVGFDARHNSKRFADLVANIFLRQNVRVNLFSQVVPTPFVSYATTLLGCQLGIMITASHNPKQDNGIKVYWSHGAQILSPHDTGICEETLHYLEPWPGSWDTTALHDNSLLRDASLKMASLFHDPLQRVTTAYLKQAVDHFCFHKDLNAKSSLKLTYTAFHGVGSFYTPLALQAFGFRPDCIIAVAEQMQPDPDFPTVKFPNPEEGRPVLELAIKTAEAAGSTLVIANDPDADRIQLAEQQPDGQWHIFTGNEQGGLLSWHVWQGWRRQHQDVDARNVFMLNSAVSSKFMQTMAEVEGFQCEETLTGFKWMGNKAQELRQQGKVVLLAWEESIGYMCGDTLDKDGVLAAALFAELAVLLQSQGLNMKQQLDRLYDQYGYHLNYTSYFLCYDSQVTQRLFDRLRNYNGNPNHYPEQLDRFKIKYIRDLTVGYDNSKPGNRPVLPVSASSQMITFTFETGSTLTIRASGTEPKIKFYIEHKTPPKSDPKDAQNVLQELVHMTVKEFMQPDVNKLIAREG